MTLVSPLNQSVSLSSSPNCRWCVPKQVSISANDPVFRVVVRRVTTAGLHRPVAGEPVGRALLAPARVRPVAHLRGHPDAALGVHHRVVRVGGVLVAVRTAAPPQQLLAPVVGRIDLHLREAGLHAVLILRPNRDLDLDGAVVVRVHDGQRAMPGRHAVDRAGGVDRGVALVGRDLVVDEGGVDAPVPTP